MYVTWGLHTFCDVFYAYIGQLMRADKLYTTKGLS